MIAMWTWWRVVAGVCDTPRRNDCHDAIAMIAIIAIIAFIAFIASGRIAYARYESAAQHQRKADAAHQPRYGAGSHDDGPPSLTPPCPML
jgi:hypothetical protein